MYLDAFGLKRLPFRLRADPEFVYPGEPFVATAVALARMLAAPPDGVIVVRGPAGVGKTTLIEYALRDAQERNVALRITQPQISVRDLEELLRAHRPEYTVDASGAAARQAPLLIVEYGERLGAATRRALQRLAEPRQRYRVLIESRDDRAAPEDPQPSSPASPAEGWVSLAPLAMESLAGYLEHRLRVAGATAPSPFGGDACAAMFAPTRGIPRFVNALCDLALAQAAERGTRRLGAAEIHGASRDPRWSAFLAAESAAAAEEPESIDPIAAVGALEPPPESLPDDADANPGEPSVPLDPPASPWESAPSAAWPGTRRAIEVRHHDRLVHLLRLPQGFLQVGRDRANDLCLDSQYVSRRHCELLVSQEPAGAEVLIIDSSSVNGILVNGRRVRRARLSPGDRIQVGDFELRLLAADLEVPTRHRTGSLERGAGERDPSDERS